MSRFLTRILFPLLACALSAGEVFATWSIVVLDKRTGEVCVASATCLPNLNLQTLVPVVVPGVGAAAAQSAGDLFGTNRRRIWDGLRAGQSPEVILDALANLDGGHQSRQYGIVRFDADPLTFSGTSVGFAKRGIAGTAGDLVFAIQGNLLTGGAVVNAARNALRDTEGHLSVRVMAAMEAAASRGGDGRCSCSTFGPTSCGVPPPNFQFSAYTGFLVLARPGDSLGSCAVGPGCANGNYFLELNVVSNLGGVEPVEELRRQFDAFVDARRFLIDEYETTVEPTATALVADGRSSSIVKLRLRNIGGDDLIPAFATDVQVEQIAGPMIATLGEPGAHGVNRFGFKLTATELPGTATYRITLRQGTREVVLAPDLVVRSDAVAPLHVGRDSWPVADGGRIPFTLNVPEAAGRSYLLFGSATGTSPGTPFGDVLLPLNRDRVLAATLKHSGAGRLPGGVLDDDGHDETELVLTPNLLWRWRGLRLHWAAVILGEPRGVTNAVGFDVLLP